MHLYPKIRSLPLNFDNNVDDIEMTVELLSCEQETQTTRTYTADAQTITYHLKRTTFRSFGTQTEWDDRSICTQTEETFNFETSYVLGNCAT